MLDTLLYYFRHHRGIYFSGLLAFAALYSAFLSFFFLDYTPFQRKLFITLFFLGTLWIVGFAIHFKKIYAHYKMESEKEKFEFLSQQISQEYALDEDNNIFKKINFISSFVKDNYSKKSLFTFKVLRLINTSLNTYIENLKANKKIRIASKLNANNSLKKKYEMEIERNKSQNKLIEAKLNEFIEALLENNTQDKNISSLIVEFENSILLLKKLTR